MSFCRTTNICFPFLFQKNTDLKTLILRHNSFEDKGAKYLKEALIENDTLVRLDLSWNHFQCKGCCLIAEGMMVSFKNPQGTAYHCRIFF